MLIDTECIQCVFLAYGFCPMPEHTRLSGPCIMLSRRNLLFGTIASPASARAAAPRLAPPLPTRLAFDAHRNMLRALLVETCSTKEPEFKPYASALLLSYATAVRSLAARVQVTEDAWDDESVTQYLHSLRDEFEVLRTLPGGDVDPVKA